MHKGINTQHAMSTIVTYAHRQVPQPVVTAKRVEVRTGQTDTGDTSNCRP